jgi:hypothetical protein
MPMMPSLLGVEVARQPRPQFLGSSGPGYDSQAAKQFETPPGVTPNALQKKQTMAWIDIIAKRDRATVINWIS